MIIAILVAVILLAALLVPLILTGDMATFFKRYALTLAIGIVGVAVAILVNTLAQKVSLRADLTTDQKYTVSPSLRNIVTKMSDQVQIIYYVSGKIQQFVEIKLNMTDKLNEIKTATNGMVDFKVEEVDQKDEKLMAELGQHGFLQQIQSNSGDEMSFSLLISGMKITYKDHESLYIPRIYYPNEVEYELGDKLIELYTKDKPSEKPVIAVNLPPAPMGANMPGRPQQGSGFEWIVSSPVSISNKKFEVKQIDMSQNGSIPEKTSLLILVRPKLMDERQRYEVEKYLAEGGKVMLLASPVRTFGDSIEQTPFGLEDYLKDCGVAFGKSILADKSHLSVQANARTFDFPPYFLRIKPENIDQTTALTRLMPGLCMPTPTEIVLDKDKLDKEKITSTILAKTTEENWELRTAPGSAEIEKESMKQPTISTKNPPKVVFAMLKGQFPFPYEGKPVPEWPTSDKDKDKEKDKDKDKPKAPLIASVASTKKEGTLVILTSPEAFYAPYLEEPSLRSLIQTGNISLLLNVTESMSYGDDLIKLRSKHYETRIISKLYGEDKEATRQIWKVALIAGVPIFVLLFAIYRFILRRINQLSYERKFAGTTGPSSFSA